MAAGTPSRKEIESVSWLVSRRIWAMTTVISVWIVLLVGVLGVVRYDASVIRGLSASVTDHVAVLAIVASSRALAFVLVQRRRDAAMASGELSVATDASLRGMVTVAAFSLIGVIATAVAMPLLVTTTAHLTYLATGIAVFIIPMSAPLLVYQLGQRTAMDRYERGFRIVPAIWHYAWTLPLVVLAWYLLLGVNPIPVSGPLARPFDVQTVFVDVWTLGYIAIGTPTLLTFLYPVRWYAERVLRLLTPT